MSDIHLSHKPPFARQAEPDWYVAMGRQLSWLCDLQKRLNEIPILCAGDVFDKWNPPPQLINFALTMLPRMFAVPGQHDLPYHSLSDLHRSAYRTLELAGRITRWDQCTVGVVGYPWGVELKPAGLGESVAIVHKYVWRKGYSYPNALDQDYVGMLSKFLDFFNAVAFGDNHKGFMYRHNVINCGTFYRRRLDERDYQPQVGVLNSDFRIFPLAVPCEQDKFVAGTTVEEAILGSNNTTQLVRNLKYAQEHNLDLRALVKRWFQDHKVPQPTRRLVLEFIDE